MDETLWLTNVRMLAAPLERWFSEHESRFRRHLPKTAGMECFANHCQSCGPNFGDHFLHDGGGFLPDGFCRCRKMSLGELPFEGEFEIEADWVETAGALLLEFTQRR